MPNNKSSEVVLEPQGPVDITRARQLQEDLLAAFAKGDKIVLKLAGVTEADLTFFQLLCAAQREASAQSKSLLIDGSGVQAPLQKLLQEGGIARQFECQHVKGQKCLWCGEGW